MVLTQQGLGERKKSIHPLRGIWKIGIKLKLRLLTIMIGFLLLAGCSRQLQEQAPKNSTHEAITDLSDETVKAADLNRETGEKGQPTASAVTQDGEGRLHFDLSGTTRIQIQSGSGHEGVTITDPIEIKDISMSLKEFTPYSPKENYEPEYDYTVTFYNGDNVELAKIKAYDNFIISYEGKLYKDESESFYLWNIRKPYIEAVKATFSVDGTTFRINGEVFDLKQLESGINSITEYFWFGDKDLPDPQVLLVGHISPYISYGAVFDVEKMDYVFKNYGTDFTYKDNSVTSLIYVFQDTVYNYWGSSLYHNTDDTVYIHSLNYVDDYDNLVQITLKSKEEEKSSEITRLNYYHAVEPEEESDPRTKLLSEIKADLTHDGKVDIIRISGAESDPELIYLDILDPDGKTRLWTETAHPAHAGWNSIYLYRKDGKDYLLVFNPYQSTGLADYTFALFYITGKNRIELVDSGAYSFSYGAKKGSKDYFDEAKFRAFADKVNTYLKDSYLLLSTEGGTLQYSTPEKHVLPSDQYETEKWLKEIKASLY
jgi:hypothetical protein